MYLCGMKKPILSVIFCLLIALGVSARNFTISGYITDSISSETLISATVYDSLSMRGALTNFNGFYSLTLPQGNVVLQYSYAGYNMVVENIDLQSDTSLNIALPPFMLGEVVVTAKSSKMGVETSQMSAIDVPIQLIKSIPALAGEVDIIKALQLMPGVQSGSEGSTGLYVRGGGPDENLILLDGIPLYNVNHMMGFFSVFNADAVKNVTLYKGNFPSRFGSRLSSVVDVRQNDGDARHYHGSVMVGLLSAKVNVEGPIWKDHTTFNISARRTYFDLLAQPIMAIAAKQNDMDRMSAGYYFYDINARLSHKFSDKDRLSFSFYMGDDAIYANIKDSDDGGVNPSGYDNSYSTSNKMKWRWGNILASLNWAHKYNNTLFSNLTVAYTKYRFSLGVDMESTDITDGVKSYQNMGSTYNSKIDDVTMNYLFDYLPHHAHEIKFGANYIFHTFKPSVATIAMKDNYDGENIMAMDTTFGNNPIYTHEVALFIEDNWSIHRVVKLNMGLRASLYAVDNKVYPSVEPRAGLRLLISKDWSFKCSYSYMSQYIHLLSSSNLTLPTDLWMPVTKRIAPMKSHQVAAGVFYNLLGEVDFSVEGYYKYMDNIIEYKDGASFMMSTTGWEDKVNMGKGWSYGVEFLMQRSVGKITGWLGYTWSRSMRQFDREGMLINDGKPFFAKYDRRHDVSFVMQYKINKKIDLSGTFVFGTGTCGTFATQLSPSGSALIESRNNFRMPNYHRLDLGINFHFPRKKQRAGEHLLSISCYNVYNHKNPYMVYLSHKYDESGVSRPALMQVSLFPIMPSISYTFKF